VPHPCILQLSRARINPRRHAVTYLHILNDGRCRAGKNLVDAASTERGIDGTRQSPTRHDANGTTMCVSQTRRHPSIAGVSLIERYTPSITAISRVCFTADRETDLANIACFDTPHATNRHECLRTSSSCRRCFRFGVEIWSARCHWKIVQPVPRPCRTDVRASKIPVRASRHVCLL
jgi:hypothetical protein